MKELPPNILKAIRSGDTEHLKNAGRKGGFASALKKDIENAQNDIAAEIKEIEEWQRKLSTNEHIIDPDGKDLNYVEDED